MGQVANRMLMELCAGLAEKIKEKKRERQERKPSSQKNEKGDRLEEQKRG